jgi:hypothetical protein
MCGFTYGQAADADRTWLTCRKRGLPSDHMIVRQSLQDHDSPRPLLVVPPGQGPSRMRRGPRNTAQQDSPVTMVTPTSSGAHDPPMARKRVVPVIPARSWRKYRQPPYSPSGDVRGFWRGGKPGCAWLSRTSQPSSYDYRPRRMRARATPHIAWRSYLAETWCGAAGCRRIAPATQSSPPGLSGQPWDWHPTQRG